jgi:hypothetical protein
MASEIVAFTTKFKNHVLALIPHHSIENQVVKDLIDKLANLL